MVQVGAELGRFVIVGANAVVGHDAHLADFVNMGPGTVVAAGVKVEENVSFFANASTMSWITIGRDSVISCGTGVKADLPPGSNI